jgi:SAM-dependent methyltransferase
LTPTPADRGPSSPHFAEVSAESYDQTPYPAHAITETHPGRLAAIARLLGVDAPAVEHARVLELGCARGGNLLPLASSLPGATFVGVDLSPVQIAEAEARRVDAGLGNVRFLVADLAALPDDLGAFDFIVCHGVLSWVPAATQRAVFAVLQRRLTATGVAFVSYNVLPGFRLRQITRDLLGFYADDPAVATAPPVTRLGFALEKLRQIALVDHETTFHRALREEAANLARCSPAYVVHEHLEDTNTPLAFATFQRLAEDHGLTWLAEAPFHRTWPDDPRARAILDLGALPPTHERLLRAQSEVDLILGRPFRRSLVVRQEALPSDVALSRGLRLEPLRAADLWVRSPPAAVDPPTPFAAAPYLDDVWPRGLSPRLLTDAFGPPATLPEVATTIVELVASTRSLELLAFQPPVAATLPIRPHVPAYARRCLAEVGVADNLFHEEVRADDPWLRRAVGWLDGTRTAAEVVELLANDASLVQTGNRDTVAATVTRILSFLLRASLLLAESEANSGA